MVECIESFQAKLEGCSLRDARCFEDRHVEIKRSRSTNLRIVSWHIAEAVVRWINEGGCIEPLGAASMRSCDTDARSEVWSYRNPLICGSREAEWPATLRSHDDVILEATDQSIPNAGVGEKALISAKGE